MININLLDSAAVIFYSTEETSVNRTGDIIFLTKIHKVKESIPKPPWKYLFVANRWKIITGSKIPGSYTYGDSLIRLFSDEYNMDSISSMTDEITLAIVQINDLGHSQIAINRMCQLTGSEIGSGFAVLDFSVSICDMIYD